jgi:hypothetical protein
MKYLNHFFFILYIKIVFYILYRMPRHDLIDKFDDEDVFIQMQYEIENLKQQISQLKEFGEIQVSINSKQARQIRQLVLENEKLNEYIKDN